MKSERRSKKIRLKPENTLNSRKSTKYARIHENSEHAGENRRFKRYDPYFTAIFTVSNQTQLIKEKL